MCKVLLVVQGIVCCKCCANKKGMELQLAIVLASGQAFKS